MKTTSSHITINAPASRVWDALTSPALVQQWQYGSELTTDWQVGSPIKFHSEWGGQVYEQWGNILAFEPNTRLQYSLFAPRPDVEDKPENYFTMTYTLDEIDGTTHLTITQEDPREQAGAASADDEEGNAVLEALKKLVEEQ